MEGVVILFFLAILLGCARLFLRGERRPPVLPRRDPGEMPSDTGDRHRHREHRTERA